MSKTNSDYFFTVVYYMLQIVTFAFLWYFKLILKGFLWLLALMVMVKLN